jgi:hypothetical protein
MVKRPHDQLPAKPADLRAAALLRGNVAAMSYSIPRFAAATEPDKKSEEINGWEADGFRPVSCLAAGHVSGGHEGRHCR